MNKLAKVHRSSTPLTTEKKNQLLEAIADLGGNIRAACRDCALSPQVYYDYLKRDEGFREKAEQAKAQGVAEMEREMHRRAFKGYNEELHHQGLKTGDTIKKYSDTLAIFMAKAHAPEKYRERMDLNHSGEVTVTVRDLLGERMGKTIEGEVVEVIDDGEEML